MRKGGCRYGLVINLVLVSVVRIKLPSMVMLWKTMTKFGEQTNSSTIETTREQCIGKLEHLMWASLGMYRLFTHFGMFRSIMCTQESLPCSLFAESHMTMYGFLGIEIKCVDCLKQNKQYRSKRRSKNLALLIPNLILTMFQSPDVSNGNFCPT